MSTSSISLSSMNAARTSLGAAAHDIAILNTPGSRRQKAQQAPQPGAAGVTTTASRAAESGDATETDLAGELQAKSSFLANLMLLRKQDKMMGALLNISG
ncbi:flagellar basal body rod protein [Paucibacter sp. PLA-PC-4]|uniref:flagellar basal body rod protein n=1 Tax=Paucibacter sp. PLA-PC-4 TaxID=2993655 RepID=UPI00224A5824|nr:flagellar basal body rod protein [Paucibacter sp. PLA-PC-4]MCX2863680.1 flagellar basal body rod protein [Paucibacter sp. PLA-PC-4]